MNTDQRPRRQSWSIGEAEYSNLPSLPYRILLVGHDEETRQLLQDILGSHAEFSILGRAGDGKEAITLATLHHPDVVLMDANLPCLHGIEATYFLKEVYPRTVIIGISDHFEPAIYGSMRTAGAAAFVCRGELLSIHEMMLYAMGHFRYDLTIHNESRFYNVDRVEEKSPAAAQKRPVLSKTARMFSAVKTGLGKSMLERLSCAVSNEGGFHWELVAGLIRMLGVGSQNRAARGQAGRLQGGPGRES